MEATVLKMATLTRTTHRDVYLELVSAFPLRRLKNATEHAKGKAICLRLSNSKDKGSRDYLDVLVDLVTDYERRAGLRVDTSLVTAAELVRHRMGERGLSVSVVAKMAGVPQPNLSEMLNGRREWSKTAIRGLSKTL